MGVEVEGIVEEALPNALYRVRLASGRRDAVVAHLAAAGLLRLLPGDVVVVRLASLDAARGRIVARSAGRGSGG